MKRVALVILAAISLSGVAQGRAMDLDIRPQAYAAEPRQTPIFIVPLYSGRSIYTTNPPFRYRFFGPRRGLRAIER